MDHLLSFTSKKGEEYHEADWILQYKDFTEDGKWTATKDGLPTSTEEGIWDKD